MSGSSPARTPSATARRRRSGVSRSSAWPSTFIASCRRWRSGRTPGGGIGPTTTSTSTAPSSASRPTSSWGSRPTSCPAREDRMQSLLEARDWDYVVGSIHFLRDKAVDLNEGEWAEFDIWRGGDPDAVWRRYFETLGEAARSGMFDILAHPDLVKVWGAGAPLPDRDLRFYYELAMEGIADSDVAIEVSTAGLRKPVGEIYPAGAVPGDVPGGRTAGRAVLGRPRAGPTRVRVRASRASGWARSGSASWPCSSGGSGGWRQSSERTVRHRLRLAPLRGRAPAGARRRRGTRGRPRPGRPFGRRCARACGDRRPARRRRSRRHRPALSRTATSAGATPTRSPCSPRSAPSSASTAGPCATWMRR